MISPEELERRLNNPLDHNANRVNQIIGGCDIDGADDWTKARAFEDLALMAIQLAMNPARDVAVELSREVGMGMLKLIRKGIDNPIPREQEREAVS